MAQALVADVETVEPRPIEEQEEHLHPAPHRHDPPWSEREPLLQLRRRRPVQGRRGAKQGVPREHSRRAIQRDHAKAGWRRSRRWPRAGSDHIPARPPGARQPLPGAPPAVPAGRVGEVLGGQDAGADRQRSPGLDLVLLSHHQLRAATPEVGHQPLPADRVAAGYAEKAELRLPLRRDQVHADTGRLRAPAKELLPVGRLPNGFSRPGHEVLEAERAGLVDDRAQGGHRLGALRPDAAGPGDLGTQRWHLDEVGHLHRQTVHDLGHQRVHRVAPDVDCGQSHRPKDRAGTIAKGNGKGQGNCRAGA